MDQDANECSQYGNACHDDWPLQASPFDRRVNFGKTPAGDGNDQKQ